MALINRLSWLNSAVALTVASALIGLSAANAQTTKPSPQYGGTLTIALPVYPDEGLNPHHRGAVGPTQVIRNSFDSLVSVDYDESFHPWLATSWTPVRRRAGLCLQAAQRRALHRRRALQRPGGEGQFRSGRRRQICAGCGEKHLPHLEGNQGHRRLHRAIDALESGGRFPAYARLAGRRHRLAEVADEAQYPVGRRRHRRHRPLHPHRGRAGPGARLRPRTKSTIRRRRRRTTPVRPISTSSW